MLNCPDCGHTLGATRIDTDAPGGTLEIDRCPFCGGVWFDHFEINRVPTNEAARLSNLAPEGELINLTGSGKCPHCSIKLTRLVGESVPANTHILHCPHCRGNWVSRKELVKVKISQNEKLSRFKSLGIPLSSIYAILLPLLLITAVTIAAGFTVTNIRNQNQTRIRASELIGSPTLIPVATGEFSRTIALAFTSSKPVTATLALTGANITSPRNLTISTTPKLEHSIWITDLSPQTTYHYTITVVDDRGEKTAEKFSFTTP